MKRKKRHCMSTGGDALQLQENRNDIYTVQAPFMLLPSAGESYKLQLCALR